MGFVFFLDWFSFFLIFLKFFRSRLKPFHNARLATYRIPTVPTFNVSNINTTHYAQMDYILINDRWKNAITDIINIQDTLLDSDHSLEPKKNHGQGIGNLL